MDQKPLQGRFVLLPRGIRRSAACFLVLMGGWLFTVGCALVMPDNGVTRQTAVRPDGAKKTTAADLAGAKPVVAQSPAEPAKTPSEKESAIAVAETSGGKAESKAEGVRPAAAADVSVPGKETAPPAKLPGTLGAPTALTHPSGLLALDAPLRTVAATEEIPAEKIPPGSIVGPSAPAVARSGVLTMEEVWQTAVSCHPLLRVFRQEVEVARGELITAGLLPNPQVVVDSESRVSGQEGASLTGRLMFTVPSGPKRRLQMAEARSAIREKQWEMSAEIKAVLVEATEAAVEVLYYQESLAIALNSQQIAAKLSEIQKERFNVMVVPYRNVVLAQLAASNAALAYRDSRALLETAQLRLARAMGLAHATPPVMAGRLVVEPLPPLSLESALAEARRVAPELARSLAAIQKSQQRLALERWNAVPDLEIGPRFQQTTGDISDNRLGARVQVDLPLFDRNQGNIAMSAAEIEVNRAKLQVAELTTAGDVAAAFLELKAVEGRLEHYNRDSLPLVEQTEKAIRDAFEDRTITAYELVDLLQQLIRMRMAELELRHQHHRLRAKLELLLECRLADLHLTPSTPGPVPPMAVPQALPAGMPGLGQ